jgi:hypothetical protein
MFYSITIRFISLDTSVRLSHSSSESLQQVSCSASHLAKAVQDDKVIAPPALRSRLTGLDSCTSPPDCSCWSAWKDGPLFDTRLVLLSVMLWAKHSAASLLLHFQSLPANSGGRKELLRLRWVESRWFSWCYDPRNRLDLRLFPFSPIPGDRPSALDWSWFRRPFHSDCNYGEDVAAKNTTALFHAPFLAPGISRERRSS